MNLGYDFKISHKNIGFKSMYLYFQEFWTDNPVGKFGSFKESLSDSKKT